jgi:hypothetical protein
MLGAGAAVLGAVGALGCIPDLPQDSQLSATEPLCGNTRIDLDAGEQCDPGQSGGPPQVTGCTATCQMYCPHGYVSPTNHHCYELAGGSSAGDHDAPRVCSSAINSHVVTFASDDEFAEVADWVDGVDAGAFWVGLLGSPTTEGYTSANHPEPGWSPACPGCYAHAPDASGPLPNYDEAQGAAAQLCVVAFSDVGHVSWYRSACNLGSTSLRTLCEREPVGSLHGDCDSGVCIETVRTYGSKRYVYVSQPTSGDEASAACQAMGGRLVIFTSREEREQLWHELWLLPAKPTRFWIGLAESDADGPDNDPVWSWDDGVRADAPGVYPSPWAEGQPTPDGGVRRAFAGVSAGQVDDTLAFVNEDQSALPFVCELAISR